LNLAVVTPAEN